MIRFKSLVLKNFASVGNAPLSINLDVPGLTLVEGQNGAGKTTLINGLYYALFGRPLRRMPVQNLVNNINKRGMLAVLELDGNGDSWTIERGKRPDVLRLVKNGTEIPSTSVKDIQKYINNNVLGMDETTFKQIVAVCSSSFVPFMHLNTSERRKIIDDILQLGIITMMHESAKAELATVKQAAWELKYEHGQALARRDAAKIRINMSSGAADGRERELEAAIMADKEQLAGLLGGAVEAQASAKNAKAMRAVAEQRLLDIQRKIQALASKAAVMRAGANAAKSKSKLWTSGTCPECGTEIDKEKAEAALADIAKVVMEAKAGITAINTETTALEAEAKAAKDEIGVHDMEIGKYQTMKMELKKTTWRIEHSQAELEKLSSGAPPDTEVYKAELELAEGKIREVEEQIAQNDMLAAELGFITSNFSDTGIKNTVIMDYLPIINSAVKQYAEASGFPFDFSFDASFNEKMSDAADRPIEYHGLSAGEQARFNFIMLFVFRDMARLKTLVSTNLMIFDEAMDGILDSDGIQALVSLIRKQDGVSAIVVTHYPEMYEQAARRRLSLSKPEKFTRMTETW